ncbi:MAG: Zinc protease [Myxococcales bacterium]|nr:Zinc protease [Myxococcales bacterium]
MVLAPDPTVSSVVVEVRYRVGAADGPAGFAHVLERMMFAGSVHVADFDGRIDAAGGWSSSVTTADHISVVDQVPAEALALALWLEAERMAGIPDAIDEARLANVQRAIAAERTSAYEDHPSGLVARAVQQTLWLGHPNGTLVLAEASGTAPDFAAFARATLVPANATLVIAGRFDDKSVIALVQRYFGWMPAWPGRVAKHVPLEPRKQAARVELEDPAAKVVFAFRTPKPGETGDAELELIAKILAGGRSSRLSKRLEGAGLATEIHADVIHQALGGELRIEALASPGIDVSRLAGAITEELAKLRDLPVSDDDMARASAAIDAELATGFQGLVFRADMLATWAASDRRDDAAESRVGDGLHTASARLHVVTPLGLRDAARTWLAESAAVIVVAGPKPTR